MDTKKLEVELKKYEKKLKELQTEFAHSRSDSAYGNEYLDIQCKVYQAMVADIKRQILEERQKITAS